MHDFFGSEPVKDEVSFERFTPICKKIIKNKEFEILKNKTKNNSGDMVDRYLSPKFGVNRLDGFRENDVYGRTTTTDARATTVALLCRAKKEKKSCMEIQLGTPEEAGVTFPLTLFASLPLLLYPILLIPPDTKSRQD